MWPFNRLKRPPTREDRLLRVEAELQLLQDRFEDQLDALKREAARVEQANRRAEQREAAGQSNGITPPSPTGDSLWDLQRRSR